MNNPFVTIIWFAVLLAIFYFILIRPQQKAMKEHQKLISELKKGDKVITRGGIYGVIKAIGDDNVILQVDENVMIKVTKNSIERLQD
jgi:preprotein translocase subunit YajC